MNKRKINHLDTESDRQIIVKKVKMPQTDILAADGTLKYDCMTSLQNITMAKIVVDLWTNQDIQQEIVNLFHLYVKSEGLDVDLKKTWQQIEDRVSSKILGLSLPNSIVKKLTSIVPIVGNDIQNWIRYHDYYVLNTDSYFEYMAVDYINNIAWNARGKINYQQTAQDILAKKDSSLSNDHKYKLACIYCLEDEIKHFASQVILEWERSDWYLKSVNVGVTDHPMVHFWSASIMKEDTKLNLSLSWHNRNERTNLSINEYILNLLITDRGWVKNAINYVPIRYMWNKLTKEEKAKNFISLIQKLGNQDLRYHLLSEIDYEQQQQVFKEPYNKILDDMFDDWLWEEHFLSTAFYALDNLNSGSYLSILKKVIIKIRESYREENNYAYDQYKSMFKQLWNEAPKHLKDFIFEHESGRTLQGMVINSFSWARDMDVIELIFADLTIEQKKEIICGDDGIIHCAHLIKNNQWDLLDSFIKNTLFCEEDIIQLKQKLIKIKGREIAVYFIDQEALDKIEHFMRWAFESQEEISQFRQNLAYVKCKSTFESIITNNKVDFTELENHFKYCVKDDLLINQIKAKIPKLPSGEILIMKLIELDQYQSLNQVLKWCFVHDQQQIEKFKNSMYKEDYISCSIRSLPYILVKKDNSFGLLNKFIEWCFTNKEEVQEFKIWLLSPQEDMSSICTDLLCEDKLELASNFIKWCFTSCEEVNKFKQKLMLSNDMEYIIDPGRSDPQDKLSLLIKWFNPTKQTVAKFKQLFPQKKCPDDFYKLLDEFIESNKSIVTNSQESLIQESQVNGNNQDYHDNDLQDELTITTVGQEGINHLDFI